MGRNYNGVSINTSKKTHETVKNLIRDDNSIKIVDIPCGSGAFISRLKDSGFIDILAIDIENILEIEHKDFIKGDMNAALPIDDNSIDVVVCIDGIEHIKRQFDFVKEVNRILKVGGELIISTPNISSLRSRAKWLVTGHHHKCKTPLDENNPNPLHHIGMISFPEIRYMLHSSGFHIHEVTTNRIKWVSWIFALLWPLSYMMTSGIYWKAGKKEGTSKLNFEIKKSMFSIPVLFGETLIVKGRKTIS